MTDTRHLMKMPVEALVRGHYVSQLDRPWTDTPFPFQGFEIQSDDEIATLRQYCRHVWVDRQRSQVAVPAGTPLPSERIPFLDDLRVRFRSASQARDTALGMLSSLMVRLQERLPVDLSGLSPIIARLDREMLNHTDAMLWLMAIHDYDDRLVEHSVNCCCLSLLLGHQLGLPNRSQAALAIAALLHEVGKLNMDASLVFSKPNLKIDDWEKIRAYPADSAAMLRNSGLDPEVLSIIRNHQERLDGEGFPDRLKADNVRLPYRILGIANAYDAMTSDWPRTPALNGHEALIQVTRMAPGRWGKELADHLTRILGIYPPGTDVALENGAWGMVVGSRPQARLKPFVVIYRQADGSRPGRLALMDTSQAGPGQRIAGPLPANRQHARIMQDITGQLLAS
ncbi:HD-GYP domain-containing protein [Natronospira bacteriovora]|uniref:DUF3391 domain-containing protein n=1 Tax=Natronospira bacteriovora TaxID=3069753 RepID=A0ABU0W5P7_9GAMM|nr:HD-GYP domain-containing protein [Natronospira sp. AB-CW4]MDQ2069350.1 DUF3391 domain-containing protein [Natronospira sp. AB-CW4]